MNTLEQMLTGQMEMPEFVAKLHSDPELRNEIRNLIPPEAVNDPSHPIWKHDNYATFKQRGSDYLNYFLYLCKFEGTFCKFKGTIGDNLNVWATLKSTYSYYYPDLPYTRKYEEMHDLYLGAIGDCFEGTEVLPVVEKIVLDALPIKGKGKRIQAAKAELKKQFHVEGRKRPYWIQGAEWPMGEKSPMKYVGQKRIGEMVQYYFEDVDTGATEIVEQYY